MIPAPCFSRRSDGERVVFFRAVLTLCALFFCLAMAGSSLMAAATTNAAPEHPTPPSAGEQKFGDYLVAHQDDLAPFFTRHSDELFKASIPILVSVTTHLLFWTLVACWAIDVFLGRGFSALFAPGLAKLKRAIVYATGQFAIGVLFSIIFSLMVIFGSDMPYIDVAVPVLAGVLFLTSFAVQVGWVIYLYRANPVISAAFYLGVLLVHLLVGLIVAVPLLNGQASSTVTTFVDQKVTPELRSEIETTQQELKTAAAARDQVKTQTTDAQNRLTAAETEASDLQKKIDEKKNSPDYIFSQIAKLHARGDLAKAHDQFTDFLTKFPSGSYSDAAKTQLDQVNTELAVQDAARKQADVDAAAAAAKARAELLDRAGKGQATLSDVRDALLGKTLDQVKELFGLPTAVASDRWGYRQRMIYDPLRGESFGLTVNFSQGVVQGVDYYGVTR
jgi:hypothetical protein